MTTFFGTSKFFYMLLAGVVFVVLITVILILRNVGDGGVGQVSLEFWGVYDSRQNFAKILPVFQKTEQGIRINYRQFSYEDYERELINALAAGTGPDIFMIHHTWLAKHRDKLAPMPESSGSKEVVYLTPTELKNQFVDVISKDLVYQDKIYGIPLYVDTLALFYNKDMFNTAGITHPPRDWDEFNEDVELLTKIDSRGNIIQAGAALGTARNINRSTDILSALMIQNGTTMTNTTNSAATFTRLVNSTRVGENALEYYTDFANPKKRTYSWNDQQHYSVDAFVEGKAAMMFNYSHQIPVVRGRFERLNFAVAPMPQFSELDAKSYANYFAVGVSSQTQKQQAAWRFLNFLASREGHTAYLAETNRPAARRDVIDVQRNDPQLGVFAVQSLSAKSWHQVDNNAVDQIFADMVDDINLGRSDVRQALRAAEAKINTLMSRRTQ